MGRGSLLMLFNSLCVRIFFPVGTVLYYVIPGRYRYLWLLAASYYFYMCWNPRYALLMAFSTSATWLSGVLLERASQLRQKKAVVAVCFLVNIGILAGFKYFDFLLENVNTVLALFHLRLIEKPFDVLLPVGISFYTFQALSYTVDVYRGEIRAEKNPLRYALFVSFFPQLVAGPIERSGNLLRQICTVPKTVKPDYREITGGLTLMLWGLFLKMVVADRAAGVVDAVFAEHYLYQATALWAAALLFAVQIYCDFSSYSTIAVGAARVMGFSLMENFNTPYFAVSIRDFWRRWHISLSTWFRDYLYIPLGGNRAGRLRRYGNLMVTFLVSGLWHGASWNFVAWGGIHGLYQIAGDLLAPWKRRFEKRFGVRTQCASYRLGQILVTFFLVDLAWVFFRADSLPAAADYLRRMFLRPDPWTLFDGSWYSWGLDIKETHVLLFGLLLLFLADLVRIRRGQRFDVFLEGECLWFRWAVILTLLFSTIVFGVYGIDVSQIQFIYFQF